MPFMDLRSEQMSINPWMMLPFGVLLALIALGPLFFPSWWGRHYAKAACGLGLIAVAYYVIGLHASFRVWRTAREYLGFIALIGSLFVVSGGIHINVKGEATPLANTLFLLIGAVISNLLGTTGASMLLIRPWLRMNKYRLTGHHVIFFIFIVSNVGGCLTPIGDPPLFLGYLAGIPFWWVAQHCLPMWAVGVGTLLLMFAAVDYRNYLRAPREIRLKEAGHHEEWRFEGLGNLFYLGVILGAVFISEPLFLREVLMVAAAAGSYFTTRKSVHDSNNFNLHPVREVVILFIGIFATMMPALDWLQFNATKLNGATAGFFYWSCGGLSGVLDNAPTYLCFLKVISGKFVDRAIISQVSQLIQTHGGDLSAVAGAHAEEVRRTFATLQKYHAAELARGAVGTDEIEIAYLLGNLKFNCYILAVSVGAVFFGANTYIGNGPNFMVKAISDHQKVRTPTFLAYIFKYTLPFMFPMLLLVWWLFFR